MRVLSALFDIEEKAPNISPSCWIELTYQHYDLFYVSGKKGKEKLP